MDKWERLVDKLIREATERGEFADLPGHGQPVDLSENPFEDPDVRTAHRLLRNAGFAPPWIEERKNIEAEFQDARTILFRAKSLYGGSGKLANDHQWQRAAKEFREKAAELNQRIRMYNLKAPAVGFHRKIIDADSLIAELENDNPQT